MNKLVYVRNGIHLISFCQQANKVFLYGAGKYGKLIKKYLEEKGIHVHSFIVTNKTFDVCCGIPVVSAVEIMPHLNNECGVVLTLSKKFYSEILHKFSFPCPVCYGDIRRSLILYYIHSMNLLQKRKYVSSPVEKCEIKDGNNILVVQVERTFGDVIWSTALLRELRKNLGHSHISMVVNKSMMSLLRHCPYIDRIIPYDLETSYDETKYIELYRRMRVFCDKFIGKYDAVFLPRRLPVGIDDLWENLFICFASGAKIRVAHMESYLQREKILVRIMKKNFTHIVQDDKRDHEVSRKLSLLSVCGLEVDRRNMELWISDKEEKFAGTIMEKQLKAKKISIALGIVSSAPVRSWSPQNYVQLIHKMHQRTPSISFILCGGQDAKDAAGFIQKNTQGSCVDLTGRTTLLEAAAIIKECDFYIGSDTGLMHMAAAFGKPIIEISHILPESLDAIDGHPLCTEPWCVPNVVVRPPCGLDGCKYACQKKYAHCINLISEDDVVNAFDVLCGKIADI